MVKVNGEMLDIAGMTLDVYLGTTDYDCRRIAVERNGEIVPEGGLRPDTAVRWDSLEVVSFVGGG